MLPLWYVQIVHIPAIMVGMGVVHNWLIFTKIDEQKVPK